MLEGVAEGILEVCPDVLAPIPEKPENASDERPEYGVYGSIKGSVLFREWVELYSGAPAAPVRGALE